ncbi:MAG: hypothetical protein HRU41_05245 [Saprospiraceae bacterium]|nr:hypothetical protein [Saprospiraceae bacterium]
MKGWLLFVVLLGISSVLAANNLDLQTGACGSDLAIDPLPKLVVEEVRMEVSQEAPVHIYDLSYEVDAGKATFTLTSTNYAINQLGFKLISQKTGEVKPSLSTINAKKIQLDLSQEPKGTYYLRLCQKSGDIIRIYRLIKAQ